MAKIDILGVPHSFDLTPPTAFPHVLVFIHGWLLSRHYWQPIIEHLSPDYQCLSYDLRGFGHSQLKSDSPAKFHAGYSAATYARDLVILLKELKISSAWLIGHSLGGSIAICSTAQFPQVIQGSVCLNTGGGIYIKEEFERYRMAGQQLLKMRPSWLCHLPLIELLLTRSDVAHPIDRAWGRQRILDFVQANQDSALGTLIDSTTEAEVHRLPQVVSQLKQPVYFIAGEQDKIIEPKYVRHLASFHPLFQAGGENVIEIPECGHLSMIEQPEAIAQELRIILNRHTPRSIC